MVNDDEGLGPNYRDEDPETSKAAGRSSHRTAQKWLMLAEYSRVWPEGLTDEAAAEMAIALQPLGQARSKESYRRRASDLRTQGYIEVVETVLGPFRHDRGACMITEKGIQMLGKKGLG